MQLSLTIILPAHNEELLLKDSTQKIKTGLRSNTPHILIIENGSTDKTLTIANRLSFKNEFIETMHLKNACYGVALKEGIKYTSTDLLAIFNVDFYDLTFLKKAIAEISNYDIIIGSKTLTNSSDKRPLLRRLITRYFTFLLRFAFAYQGSDSHGMKLMRTDVAKKLAQKCGDFHELFDTEFMIRAERLRLRIKELPVSVAEQRTPVSSIVGRMMRSLKELFELYRSLNK